VIVRSRRIALAVVWWSTGEELVVDIVADAGKSVEYWVQESNHHWDRLALEDKRRKVLVDNGGKAGVKGRDDARALCHERLAGDSQLVAAGRACVASDVRYGTAFMPVFSEGGTIGGEKISSGC